MEFQLSQNVGLDNSVYIHDNEPDPEKITMEDHHKDNSDKTTTLNKGRTFNNNNNKISNEDDDENGGQSVGQAIELRDRDDEFIVKRKRSAAVSYETVVWVVFFVFNVAILIDRFTGKGDVIFEKKGKNKSNFIFIFVIL